MIRTALTQELNDLSTTLEYLSKTVIENPIKDSNITNEALGYMLKVLAEKISTLSEKSWNIENQEFNKN